MASRWVPATIDSPKHGAVQVVVHDGVVNTRGEQHQRQWRIYATKIGGHVFVFYRWSNKRWASRTWHHYSTDKRGGYFEEATSLGDLYDLTRDTVERCPSHWMLEENTKARLANKESAPTKDTEEKQ